NVLGEAEVERRIGTRRVEKDDVGAAVEAASAGAGFVYEDGPEPRDRRREITHLAIVAPTESSATSATSVREFDDARRTGLAATDSRPMVRPSTLTSGTAEPAGTRRAPG